MKIPSLFRTAHYQRFRIEPRYYDPVKEEIEARTSRIRAEMEGTDDPEHLRSYATGSRLNGAFVRRASKKGSINIMQMVILMILVGMVAGYWYFGSTAVYIILGVSSVLLYLKFKRIL